MSPEGEPKIQRLVVVLEPESRHLLKTSPPGAFRNRLLASLPPSDMSKLAKDFHYVELTHDQTLQYAGQRVDKVYFLEDGICSEVATLIDGSTAQVSITGREGVVGLPAILGTSISMNRSFIQIAGAANRISADALAKQCAVSGELRHCLERYTSARLTQTAQTAICNRVHRPQTRLSRLLLMYRERMQTDLLPITQESLATMIGAYRSNVSVAAEDLKRAGVIDYSHGLVKITNRRGLERAACECYLTVHKEYVRLGLL